jgi:acyl-coenzyme A thioesterase PaaI-like protein
MPRLSPRLLRWVMNLWPPYLGAGIRVCSIAADWSEAVVELRERLTNRNYVGTHFGGSLFAMTDPFYALLLMHRLGARYLVWDQAARIEFVAPGRGTVSARFLVTEELLESVRRQAAGGEKVLPEFDVEIRDRAGALVARVRKTVYVRLKPRFRPGNRGQSPDSESGSEPDY